MGTTGLGVDLSRVSISSNNLGEHDRIITNIFAEHRFLFLNDKLDITPGIAFNNYTDFGTRFFPGIDLGMALSSRFRAYGNIGSTYRIPTYTDLYYSDRTTLGNESLKPESALALELGFRLSGVKSSFICFLFQP